MSGAVFAPVFRRRIEHVDTDAAGVVHFSRYLSLVETAVLEFIEEHDAGLAALAAHDIELALTETRARYLRPARYRDVVMGDVLLDQVGAVRFRASVTLSLEEPDGTRSELVIATLTFAAIGSDGQPVAFPPTVRNILKGIADDAGYDGATDDRG